MRSYTESLNTANMGMKMMKLFSYGLTALIAFISFMNMANTMITGIVTRKQEFGVLQAIGMTNRQLNKMLREEGLFFSLGTVVISLLLGLPLGYGLFLYGKNHSWMGLDEYTVPLTEILVMIVALAALQLILSWILSRNVKKESLVERIRYQGSIVQHEQKRGRPALEKRMAGEQKAVLRPYGGVFPVFCCGDFHRCKERSGRFDENLPMTSA